MNDDRFNFEFSLEVLNHLGRGLYRSFATVVAEAISNAWDAEATEVYITLDYEKQEMVIEDNGTGMDKDGFRDRFLKVGYSRRKDPENKSRRTVIGRKGIGKLAMLSVSNYVKIASKKKGGEVIGGIIDNTALDKAIKDDGRYFLNPLDNEINFRYKNGTQITFNNFREVVMNSENILRKYIATQFNFIFSEDREENFEIFVNDREVNETDLKELNDKTQFIWFLQKEEKNIKCRYKYLKGPKVKIIENCSFEFKERQFEIKGFIASVTEPKHLTMRSSAGTFKTGVHLFCNGRLRQEDILQEITSKRVVESFLYGEVHVNGFDGDDEIDRFTSSREGIIKSDPLFQAFLEELKKIQSVILKDWDNFRREIREDGDPENTAKISKYMRSLENARNHGIKKFKDKLKEIKVDKETMRILKKSLEETHPENNTKIYQDLFILENAYRTFVYKNCETVEDLNKFADDGRDDEIRGIIKALKKRKESRDEAERKHALKGKVVENRGYLDYVDLVDLGILVDKLKPSSRPVRHAPQSNMADTKEVTPVRNAVMHTNQISDDVMRWDKIKNVIDYLEKLNSD